MSDTKKYDSMVCFQGKRVAEVRTLAKEIFQDSFLCIEVDHHKMEFVIRLDHRIDAKRAEKFQSDHKQCRLVVYKEISLQSLKTSSK